MISRYDLVSVLTPDGACLLPIRRRSETLTTLLTTAGDVRATALGRHASAKAVSTAARYTAGLVSTLTHNSLRDK